MADSERELEDISLEDYEAEKEPLGENNLSSFAMFTQRKKYNDTTYPVITIPSPFDLWYDKNKHYFGKLDERGYAIVAREKYLKQLPGGPNSFALDFVVDAFNAFKEKYTFLNKRQTAGTPFQFLETKSAWTSVAVNYNNYLDGVFRLFVDNFMTQEKRDTQLVDFRSFVKLFYRFIRYSEGNIPITFSSFIKSSFCSPQSSGLMIELSDDSHGNDSDKYNHFIKNINFECYARTAEEFGFKLDKNYPGRLIADVQSPQMQEYMSAYPKKPKRLELSEPQAPVFELPDVASPELQSPWAPGDTVEMVVIRPQDPSDPYYILGGYTNPQNQKFGAGVRAGSAEVQGNIVNKFNYMVDNLLGTGRATKLFLKLSSTGGRSSRTIRQSAARNVQYLRPVGGTIGALVIGVENSFSDSQGGTAAHSLDVNQNRQVEEFFAPRDSSIFIWKYLSFDDFMANGLNDAIVTQPPRRWHLTRDNEIYITAPNLSIHLSNAVQQPTSTIERFNRYYRERDDITIQQQKYTDYRTFVYEPLYKKYEEELKIYQRTISNYDKQLELYDTLPKPMSYKNFIDARYNLGYRVDVDMLKEMLTQFYYSYTSSRPTVFLTESVKCGTSTPLTKRRTVQREQLSRNIINEKYGDREFWIRLYGEMKGVEDKNRIKPDKLEEIIYNTVTLFRQSGEGASLKYLTEQFQKFS